LEAEDGKGSSSSLRVVLSLVGQAQFPARGHLVVDGGNSLACSKLHRHAATRLGGGYVKKPCRATGDFTLQKKREEGKRRS